MSDQLAAGFLSYARSDDDRESGRISGLAERIASEFETLTGSKIVIFVDRKDIKWGEGFRGKLGEALQNTTFFIPVLTPTYFQRDECRNEMIDFVNSAKALGLGDLLMSIRYVPVPDLREESGDELKAVAAKMQYEDWTSLRLLDEESAQYRTGISKLAQRLVELTHILEKRGPNIVEVSGESSIEFLASADVDVVGTMQGDEIAREDDADKAGLIDLLADLEPALEAWTGTMLAYSEASEPFSELLDRASEDFQAANQKPNSFALKVIRARKLALELDEPLQKMEELSKEYSSGIMRLDPIIQAFLSQFELAFSGGSEEERSAGLVSLESLRNLVAGAIASMDSAEVLAKTAKSNQDMSRDLRPIWRRHEVSSRNFSDARYVVENWKDQADKLAHGVS